MAQGYPSPEDIALLLEEVPPPTLQAFLQALRDHRDRKETGGAKLCFSGTRGQAQDWGIERMTRMGGVK